MSLRAQPRKEYSDHVFNIDGHEENNNVVLLHFDDNGDAEELDRLDAEYMFLTETLGWKNALEDPKESKPAEVKHESAKMLAEYLFLTEQMNWKKGLKVFQEKGETAIQSELQQIHDVAGFQPKHWYELTKEERAAAPKYLMYLKEKRDGRIKGRGCADGRSQKLYANKTES